MSTDWDEAGRSIRGATNLVLDIWYSHSSIRRDKKQKRAWDTTVTLLDAANEMLSSLRESLEQTKEKTRPTKRRKRLE